MGGSQRGGEGLCRVVQGDSCVAVPEHSHRSRSDPGGSGKEPSRVSNYARRKINEDIIKALVPRR